MVDIKMLILNVFLIQSICILFTSGLSPLLSSNQLMLTDNGRRVERSTCSDESMLTADPAYAGMYGGRIVDLTGPCFSTTKQVYCQFVNPNNNKILETVKALHVSRPRVRCMVPRLLVRDRVVVSVSTDDGRTYPYKTNITIVFPGRMPGENFVKNVGPWFFHNATVLNLKWDNTLLSNDHDSLVDIHLIGFKENDGKAMYKPLAMLGKDVAASAGRFEFDVSNHQCSGQDCDDYEVGLVEVKLQDQFTPTKNKFLSTNRVALGWYVKNEMKTRFGSEWPSDFCMNWYNKASKDMKWFDEILKCPCSLAQAISDFGRWQPDTGCNLQKADNPRNCFYHHAAVHCVRSVQPVKGAGNQCCYSSKGYLVFAADTYFGSTADKSHDWGAAPYGKPGHIPILSHWVDDIIPLFSCCQWTDFKSCDHYVKLRGTTDCTEYSPPVPASVYGLGHITTFRGQTFRILAPGDYILLKAENTEVQARFESYQSSAPSGKNLNKTFTLTSVAVLNKGISDRVELRLHKPDSYNFKHYIEVLINGKVTAFEEIPLKWQDFKEVAVINTDKDGMNGNFTVLLTNNIGFQVTAVAGTLQLDLMMPTDTCEITSGLFGNIDGQKTLPNRMPFNIDVDRPSELYNKFEQAWRVKSNNLFFETKTFSGTPILSPTEENVDNSHSLCTISTGVSDKCEFDFKHTGSREIAQATKDADIRHESLVVNLKPVRSCGLLNVPTSKKSNYEYTIGTTTTITGCRTGSLSGTTTYTCVQTSNETQAWSPEVTAKCVTEMDKSSNIGMIVGIVVAVIVVTAIIAVAIIFVMKRRNKNRKDGSPFTPDEAETMKADDL